jgi:hypothetical protein
MQDVHGSQAASHNLPSAVVKVALGLEYEDIGPTFEQNLATPFALIGLPLLGPAAENDSFATLSRTRRHTP